MKPNETTVLSVLLHTPFSWATDSPALQLAVIVRSARAETARDGIKRIISRQGCSLLGQVISCLVPIASPVGSAPCKGSDHPVGARPTRQLGRSSRKAAEVAVEVTKLSKPLVSKGRFGDSASWQAVTRVNTEQAPKTGVAGADPPSEREGRSQENG